MGAVDNVLERLLGVTEGDAAEVGSASMIRC